MVCLEYKLCSIDSVYGLSQCVNCAYCVVLASVVVNDLRLEDKDLWSEDKDKDLKSKDKDFT